MRLGPGGAGTVRFAYRGCGGSAPLATTGRVSPWPFAPASVGASVPARILAGVRWESADELRSAWLAAPVVEVVVRLVPMAPVDRPSERALEGDPPDG